MQFIPSKVDFSPESQKLWQGNLGLIGFEDNVVFTKASLVQFLKLHDIVVDPNGTELKKLPKYAKFGKLVETQDSHSAGSSAGPEVKATPERASTHNAETAAKNKVLAERPTNGVVILPNGEEFRPTRKVRELPGGGSSQIKSLFGGEDEQKEDQQPPRRVNNPQPAQANPTPASASPSPPPTVNEKQGTYDAPQSNFRPTRKVRELPGGGSSQISALFGGGDD